MSFNLTPIGNIKIGAVRGNKPIATDKIYIRTLTKEGEENFKAFPGTNEKGYSSIKVQFPFDTPELNFEVSYTSFVKINDIDYILKAKDFGDEIVGTSWTEAEAVPYRFGKLTKESMQLLNMSKSGILYVHVPEVSSFGEVFVFKTRSINTINAIQNQLDSFKKSVGYIAGIPFTLRTVKKETSEGTFNFLSLSLDSKKGIFSKKIKKLIAQRKEMEDLVNQSSIDKEYAEYKKVDYSKIIDFPKTHKLVFVNYEDDLKKAEKKPPKSNKEKKQEENSDIADKSFFNEVNKILLKKYSSKIRKTPTMTRAFTALIKELGSRDGALEFVKELDEMPSMINIAAKINSLKEEQ